MSAICTSPAPRSARGLERRECAVCDLGIIEHEDGHRTWLALRPPSLLPRSHRIKRFRLDPFSCEQLPPFPLELIQHCAYRLAGLLEGLIPGDRGGRRRKQRRTPQLRLEDLLQPAALRANLRKRVFLE